LTGLSFPSVAACRTIRARIAAWAAARFAGEGLAESPADVGFAGGWVYDTRRPAVRMGFAELCAAARRDRVDLGARGFYATPIAGFDAAAGRGEPFFYFTQGAAVAEVRIDRFTGELAVPRVDLLIDIGRSINPGVDRGQVIGGFVQGMGWVTAECLVYDERGVLLSDSPTTYLGVIGSRVKREVLRKELEAAGVPAAASTRLRCPIGLPVGGNQPGEIAVSVAAEILQVRGEPAG
jgi:xanthine dehydrogenase large subunit